MLRFEEKGTGDPLLLVHAFPLDHTMWHHQVEFFKDRYRIITPDLPGFGGTPLRPWDMKDMGEELLRLLDQLKIQQCVLGGLSMGGYIVIPFAARHPERVSKLVLAHTRARADTEVERAGRSSMIAALQKDGAAVLPVKVLPRLVSPAAGAEVREWLLQTMARVEPAAAIQAVEAMRARGDSTPLLGAISCPALVVAGDADTILKVEDARAMAAALPRGTLAVIPDTGHLSPLENPATFNRILDAFLRES